MQAHQPQQITIAHQVLFQVLDNESIMLNLRNDAYYRLDDVGTRLWQLFTELGAVEPVVAQMLTEYQVDEKRLRQDVADLLQRMMDAGVVTVAP